MLYYSRALDDGLGAWKGDGWMVLFKPPGQVIRYTRQRIAPYNLIASEETNWVDPEKRNETALILYYAIIYALKKIKDQI